MFKFTDMIDNAQKNINLFTQLVQPEPVRKSAEQIINANFEFARVFWPAANEYAENMFKLMAKNA